MRKRFDDIFTAMMLAAGVAVILIVCLCLFHSIAGVLLDTVPATSISIEPPQVSLLAKNEEDKPLAQDEAQIQEDKTVTYDPNIPLSPELQSVLQEACDIYQVPECLALGLIEVESRFDPDADNGQCYGLCQLNRDYFPDKLSPADNIREGMEYFGRCLTRYGGDMAAALTSYNAGHDTGYRGYANAVMAAAERWR